ncbi:MAG TPA: FAD-dependent oxidoreductase [Candidatus Binatia bacterium]|nr:FAD-dependent oxidoreductase [Candidatus Binatia bacterium]
MNVANPERHEAIVIGAGQAGLSAAHYLAKRGIDHVVLEAADRVGDQWRSRYDSLRLYSPARYDGLPGQAFPLPPNAFPTGNQMADYLESYAAHFDLPVRTGTAVDGLQATADGDGYVVTAGGRAFEAPEVVIAAGFFRMPYTPSFAPELDPGIRQMHSNDYRRPSQLADGPVLVVGLSHSGADMAIEAVENGHPTIVSGKAHGQLPFSVDSRTGRLAWPIMKFLAWNVLTIRTPIGRKMRPEIRANGGGPLLRHRKPDLERAGVELVEDRIAGVSDGKPMTADGRVLDVANVIWCTGFRPDFSWIQLPIFGDDGLPREERGVVTSVPGIYFVGLLFQYSFTSMLVVGAGRDAEHVVDRLALHARARSRAAQPERVIAS